MTTTAALDPTAALEALKRTLTTGPVLQMPDFDATFVVDCNASGAGFGAILHQGAEPLAYFSRTFAARHLKLAAYERELIGLVQGSATLASILVGAPIPGPH